MSSSSIAAAVRAAHPDEAAVLTALALRSKRHWGYDEAFMSAAKADMEISPALLASSRAFVAESGGTPLAFYVLAVEAEGPTLRDLWVDPTAIGTGLGKHLWDHMLAEAYAAGFEAVRIVSDPHAAGFYAKMGASQVGEVESCVLAGRLLPLFRATVKLP